MTFVWGCNVERLLGDHDEYSDVACPQLERTYQLSSIFALPRK